MISADEKVVMNFREGWTKIQRCKISHVFSRTLA